MRQLKQLITYVIACLVAHNNLAINLRAVNKKKQSAKRRVKGPRLEKLRQGTVNERVCCESTDSFLNRISKLSRFRFDEVHHANCGRRASRDSRAVVHNLFRPRATNRSLKLFGGQTGVTT